MRKIITMGSIAHFIAASTFALAQSPSRQAIERPSASNCENLTDARFNIVHAALQTTADQEKYWPAIEDAIRSRAKDRQHCTAAAAERTRELHAGKFAALRDRDPVKFLHRRADTLARRASDLMKLADTWQPLYQTLDFDQKRRTVFLMVFVLREMDNGVEQSRLRSKEESDSD
jgi:hypothetical protein